MVTPDTRVTPEDKKRAASALAYLDADSSNDPEWREWLLSQEFARQRHELGGSQNGAV